jgi:glyoxylase-like metal-dependent hydrolase (beta-lactamase superfamily II)
MKTQYFGEISVQKVLDGIENFRATIAFPEINLDLFHQHRDWISPFYDFNSETILISMHSYIIRTPKMTAVVDTCIGNNKYRIGNGPIYQANKDVLSHWNLRNSSYLENLISAGVHPEEVDYVMCTHMHADHVGWNTKLENGKWVPTFPNAKYLFSPIELKAMQEQTDNPFDEYIRLVFEDSVLPVIESGQSVMMDNDFDLGRGINILPSPGHSPGHYCIELQSKNSQGIITGDIFHNPIQVNYPHWTTMFCDNKEQANETRIKLVDDLIDSETIILAAHFAGTTAGKIISESNNKKFILLD